MKKIFNLCQEEIKKVTGCTEPASISLTFAKASSILKEKTGIIDFSDSIKARIFLSQDVYRNASTVKIPFLQLKGIKPAVAYGIYNSSTLFNTFAQNNPKEEEKIIKLIKKSNWLKIISLKKRGIYIRGELKNKENNVQVIIEDKHDNIKKIVLNKEIIFNNKRKITQQIKNIEEIKRIVKQKNQALETLAENFIIEQGKVFKKFSFKDISDGVEKLVEKRMEGENISIMTITGSGNQGILLSLPFYELYKKNRTKVIPAVLFSILVQIYLTQKNGRISDLCGLANKTAPALIAGLSYYYGANFDEIINQMKLVSEILKGMRCDGAKKSCALKAYLVLNGVFKVLKLNI